jgi:hypothetical protein
MKKLFFVSFFEFLNIRLCVLDDVLVSYTLKSLGIETSSKMTAIKAMEDAKVVGVENWQGNFYPSGKILLFFLVRV